jgi:hypothetical protein
MALTFKVTFTGQEKLIRALGKMKKPELALPVGRFLVKAGLLVLKNAAEKQILRGGRFRGAAGPRGGKGAFIDSPPAPHQLTSRSGELRRSLGASRGLDRGGLSAFFIEFGSDMVYAPIHELGLGRYPVRAFLQPGLDEESSNFEGMLAAELEQAMNAA